MATPGEQRKLHHKYAYLVQIDGFNAAVFNKCSELSFEAADVEHYEGGSLIPHKEPGRITVPDVTLDRGKGLDRDMHDWAVQMVDFAKQAGAVPSDLKKNIDVVQLDRDGTEIERTTLFNCYPKKYVFGEWDSDADEVVVEQLVLRYDFPKDTTNT